MSLRTLSATGLAVVLLVGSLSAGDDCANPNPGPDVIVGSISGVGNYGGLSGVGAYSLGTTSCNIGTEVLDWFSNSVNHPVIGQNIYRLENGRIEQLGLSWLKHGFAALQGTVCCSCTPSGNSQQLGVGCSDPYGSGLNGSQSGLGPRFEVNPFTGSFLWPYTGQGSTGDALYKRIQVANSDLDPSLHPTALYFGEGQYVTPDDAAAGNHYNNASYRQLTVGGFSNGSWNLSASGATMRQKPAIQAWSDNDPSVTLAIGKVPGEGTYYVGSKATNNTDGTWHYEYAIQNLTSDVSIGRFTVPVPLSANITNIGFKDVDYHSGEPFDGTDWVGEHTDGQISWETESFADNEMANAIRWGTLYNFWFDSDVGPDQTQADIGFFKPHVVQNGPARIVGPLTAETWSNLGGGTSGVNGQPDLVISGPLTPVSTLSLDMTNGAPSELAVIFISVSSSPIPFIGGTLHTVPLDDLALVVTDGAGELHGSVTFDGAPPGTTIYFQVGVQDASVPTFGASLSNGVVGLVP